MMMNVVRIKWDQAGEALPAFATMITMPLTYSVAYGTLLISLCSARSLCNFACLVMTTYASRRWCLFACQLHSDAQEASRVVHAADSHYAASIGWQALCRSDACSMRSSLNNQASKWKKSSF